MIMRNKELKTKLVPVIWRVPEQKIYRQLMDLDDDDDVVYIRAVNSQIHRTKYKYNERTLENGQK